MIFTEGRFLLLFLACFGVLWALRSHALRKAWLLLCSAVFYGAWDPRFLLLMYASATVDYVAGRWLAREERPRARRLVLVGSLAANLLLLGFFKYFNFFVESAVALSAWLGLPLEQGPLEIVLPVGISFFTFQSMSYTIDVYRRQLEPTRSYLDFSLFVTFFPQLVAGPIVRARDFLPQLARPRSWSDVGVRGALLLFLVGYVKKACIADNLALSVDRVFSNPECFDQLSNWTAVVLYAAQIYCDFSGYSDMAIACAALLGYRLTLNFDFPYLAGDIATFWRRWHVSLSTWFRDYLYIPLGGNRRGGLRTYFNLFTVFFLCGLWHGASWNFVAWGLLHGGYLVVHRVWSGAVRADGALGRAGAALGWVLTPLAVLVAWVVFRGEDWGRTQTMLAVQFGWTAGGADALALAWWPLMLGLLAAHVLARRRTLAPWVEALPDVAFALAYGFAVALVLPFASAYQPFIYFQF